MTSDDILRAMEAVSQAIRPGYDLIGDMRRARVDIPLRSNSEVVNKRLERGFQHATAVVVSDQMSFASFSQYATLSDVRGGGQIAVFYSMKEAEDWLAALREGSIQPRATGA